MTNYLTVIAAFLCLVVEGAEAPTNILSFHLVADKVSREVLINGRIKPRDIKYVREPVLSDTDFVALDFTNHTFAITAVAVRRFAENLKGRKEPTLLPSGEAIYDLCGPDTPFVLVASEEPVWVGVFLCVTSSSEYRLPTILPQKPFVLASSTSNLTFTINIPHHRAGQSAREDLHSGGDVRSDNRIRAAVKALEVVSKFICRENAA